MSKKDYTRFAKIIKEALLGTESVAQRVTVTFIALSMADYFAEDNSNFDRDRFLQACGMRDGIVMA